MYVYIITHPKFEGWIKLGRTIKIKERLNAYQTCCPNREFKLEYFIKTNYPDRIERYFSKNIKGNGFEWFLCSIDEAISIIEQQINLIDKNDAYLKPISRNKYIKKLKKEYGSNNHNIKYDYIIDEIIFNSVVDLCNYIGVDTKMFYRECKFIRNGNVIEINNYRIIKLNHVK
jgi:hypothetical protein